jgi:hypothetical protein
MGRIINMHSGLVILLLSLASGAAFAGVPPSPVSEPGILELLSIGAVAALVVAIRKRRK